MLFRSVSPLGVGLRVGVELVSAMVVSVGIGWGLDRWLGTKPWMLLLFVPIGGGSGASGCCIARDGLSPKTQVIGVQAAGADAVARSLRTGQRVVGTSATRSRTGSRRA